MTTADRQAELKKRLQAMGVMQGPATSKTPDTISAHDSGFSRLIPLMIIAIIVSGVFIYWLTLESSKHKSTSQITTQNDNAKARQTTKPVGAPATQVTAPEHNHMQFWRPDENQAKAGDPSSTSGDNKSDKASGETQTSDTTTTSRTPARPVYPAYPRQPYPGQYYPYTQAPYPPYARPPLPPGYMVPPGYPYPPAPWPQRP